MMTGLVALALLGGQSPDTFQNPIIRGADPWVGFHNGWYYLSWTTGSDVRLRKARKVEQLKTAPETVVWKDDDSRRNRDMWAPEFHLFDGHWYLYFTAGDGREPSHRAYVAKSEGDDPLGPYHMKAKLKTDPNDEYYAIDLHPFRLEDGRMFAVWCGRPSAAGQGLYIQAMSNPFTLVGERQYLDVSGLGCQWVREGPYTLQRNGKVFLTYSACGADTPDYRVGMVIADAKADLMDPSSWRQHPEPLLSRNDANKVYGPGHHSFFRSPDGKEDWIAFHAKAGTGITFADRMTRLQKVSWSPDGLPVLGVPLPDSERIAVPSGEPM